MARPSDGEGGVLVLVACVSLEQIDPALLRPGRLSFHVKLDLPSEKDIRDILSYKLRDIPSHSDLALDVISETLFHLRASCADVDFVCREAILVAIRNIIDHISTTCTDLHNHEIYEKISSDHFLIAIRKRYGVSAIMQ